mmetsp:Transcript_42509/g.92610  ORF Transcript_42509/g.92610 Transcript_42509/m.92610 type:complete len:312 (+) Transcript_42509:74-1009(+)
MLPAKVELRTGRGLHSIMGQPLYEELGEPLYAPLSPTTTMPWSSDWVSAAPSQVPLRGDSCHAQLLRQLQQLNIDFADHDLRNLERSSQVSNVRALPETTRASNSQPPRVGTGQAQLFKQIQKSIKFDHAVTTSSAEVFEIDAPTKTKETQQQVHTLSSSLQMLANEDPECLFIVRRIHKLGFKSAAKLKRHFSAIGPVVRVLLAHSTVRQYGDPHCSARRRPSSLGFVQMARAESVRQVLALGPAIEICGSTILVQRFERQPEPEESSYQRGHLSQTGGWAGNGTPSEASSTTASSSSRHARAPLHEDPA